MHAHHPSSLEEIKQTIRDLELRVTPARIALVQHLQNTELPQSIDQMTIALSHVGMDKATVYRNIVILQAKNLVRQVDLHRDHAYYEWNDKTDHHHLICTRCNYIEDFTGCDFKALEKAALKQAPGFSHVVEHSFELFGVCRKCAEKGV